MERLKIAEQAVEHAKAYRDSMILSGDNGGPMYEQALANLDQLESEYRAAQIAVYESGKSTIEAAGEIYLVAIDKAQHAFMQAVSNKEGLELLQSKYDNFINTILWCIYCMCYWSYINCYSKYYASFNICGYVFSNTTN